MQRACNSYVSFDAVACIVIPDAPTVRRIKRCQSTPTCMAFFSYPKRIGFD